MHEQLWIWLKTSDGNFSKNGYMLYVNFFEQNVMKTKNASAHFLRAYM